MKLAELSRGAAGPDESSQGGYDPRAPLLEPFLPHVARFSDGRDSPRHFLERCLAAIAERDVEIQAFTAIDADAARLAADDASIRYREGRVLSPIDGMPVGLKDIIETADLPTEMNSPIFAGFRPRRDAASVVALKAAGAVVLGKTVTTEFACGRSGPTRNPYDVSRTPGGSSSGSAAAVGGGLVPGALGTQTQASVIRPASYCGAYAIKPSHGLLSFDGCAPLAPTLDTLGLFGASLDDAWALAATIGRIARDPRGPVVPLSSGQLEPVMPRRLIRLDTVGWREVDDSSRAAFEAALGRLAQAGTEIIDRRTSTEVEALEQALLAAPDMSMQIFAYESQWPLRSYRALGERLVGERVHDLIARAAAMGPADYAAAVAARRNLRGLVARLAAHADGFVALASSGVAIADISFTGSRSYPVPWSLVGGPSIALPVLASEGLPLGLQVMGDIASDSRTVAVAAAIRDRLLDSSDQA